MSHHFLVTFVVAMIYLLLGLAGQTMAIPPGNVTPVWPPSGFALAAILIYGRSMWSGILIGAFLVNTQAFVDISSLQAFINAVIAGIAISIGSLLQPVFGSWFLTYNTGSSRIHESPQGFLRFSLVTPIICLISCSIGSISLFLVNETPASQFLTVWTTWWLGDSLGILLFTPLILMTHDFKPTFTFKPTVILCFVVLIITTLFSFGVFFTGSMRHYPLAFLSLPILLIFSFQYSRLETMIAALVLSGTTTVLTLTGHGQFVVEDQNTSLLLLQSFIAITTVTAMTISILSHCHTTTESLLRHENSQRSVSETELLQLKNSLEEKVSQRTQELIMAKNLAEQLARTDALTHMKNRRAFFEEYQYIFNLCKRHGQTLALLIIDIDHFKVINDTYGHHFGDHVLSLIANTILNSIRESEISARLGGEEFIVLVPQSDISEATLLAEKIRKNIACNDVRFESKRVKVSVSIGVTQQHKSDSETMKSILTRADKALYMAKTQGRNRVCKL